MNGFDPYFALLTGDDQQLGANDRQWTPTRSLASNDRFRRSNE